MVEQGTRGIHPPGDHGGDIIVGKAGSAGKAEQVSRMGDPAWMVRSDAPLPVFDPVEPHPSVSPETGRVERSDDDHFGIDRQKRISVDMPRERESAQLLRMPAAQGPGERCRPNPAA